MRALSTCKSKVGLSKRSKLTKININQVRCPPFLPRGCSGRFFRRPDQAPKGDLELGCAKSKQSPPGSQVTSSRSVLVESTFKDLTFGVWFGTKSVYFSERLLVRERQY